MTLFRFLVSHLRPGGSALSCFGRSPASSSSNPEEESGSRNSVPSVQSLSPSGWLSLCSQMHFYQHFCCTQAHTWNLCLGRGCTSARQLLEPVLGAHEAAGPTWLLQRERMKGRANKCLLLSERPLLNLD